MKTLTFCDEDRLVIVLCELLSITILLLTFILIVFGIKTGVQTFSFGLSLPMDTGRGLSEHGDASRDTVSESSSLNILPIVSYRIKTEN